MIARRIHRAPLFIAMLAVTVACGSGATPATVRPTPSSPSTFVLVHGAWMGAWGWEAVATQLRARGSTVITVELPGHGQDQTPVSGATLDAYAATVTRAIESSEGKVMLVGHSMAGIVISTVAEQHPDKLRGVVYLAAYVPKDNETLQQLAGTDAASHVGAAIHIDAAHGVAGIAREKLDDVFCADCSAAASAALAEHYRDEPLPAFGAPVRITPGAWGKVAKFYIFTTEDHAISPELQQRMTEGVSWVATARLATSHAPFLSNPTLVVDTLATFAESSR